MSDLEDNEICICDNIYDEQQQQEIIEPSETSNQKMQQNSNPVYVFDDDDNDYQEEIVCSKKGVIHFTAQKYILSQAEYEDTCRSIKDKIMFNNPINHSKDIVKSHKTFFQEAKQKRKQSQYLRLNRDKQNTMGFKPRITDVKIDFVEGHIKNMISESTAILIPIIQEGSFNQEIKESIKAEKKLMEKNSWMKGVQIEKKQELKIEEIKYRNLIKVSNFRDFLFSQLKPSYQIFITIKKTDSGLFNTTYKCYFKQNKKFILSCEKQGFTKYIFSSSEVNIAEDHISYLGKMQSNFSGTEFMAYDSGEDCTATKMMENYKKQIAYILYEQEKGQPIKMQTYTTTCDNQQTDYTIKDKNSNPISCKWEKGQTKNLCKLKSKYPTYDLSESNYKLDFRGMAGVVASIKNFILSSQQYYESLIFGRHDKDTFLVRIKSPFSIMQAVSICMSSIHYKFM